MVNVALLVRLEAKPGKENEVESFLKSGLAIVEEEPDTIAWFAIRMSQSTFGIFDAFPDESGTSGPSLRESCCGSDGESSELLAQPPAIEKVDVLAAKLRE
jgi:hypothetical protein